MALSNRQYDSLIRIYDKRRDEARRRHEQALERIERTVPSYAEYSGQIGKLLSERAVALIGADEERAERLSARAGELSQLRAQALTAAGYAPDFDQIKYTCQACKDTGFIGSEKCRCFKQMEAELLYDASNIRDILERENFDTFNPSLFSKTEKDKASGRSCYELMTQNFARAHEMADTFVPGKMNLLFTGAAGTGKTFLSNCIAREVIKQGYSVVYLSASLFFKQLADAAFGRSDSDDNQIMDCDLLIIDDLGTEYNNTFVSSQLFCCINERRLRAKSTIISTNLDMNQLRDTYSERVSSRLLESYKICRFCNPDIRIIKRQMGI